MIEVCAGNFTENVSVALAGLQIVGEEAVTLRCPHYGVGSGFDLFAINVTIQGFDISNCASAISVEPGFGRGLFTQNSLHNNTTGISINISSGDNSVINNAIYGNSEFGVLDYQPLGDYITSNTVQGNGYGIDVSTTGFSADGGGCPLTSAVISGNEVVGNSMDGVLLNNADCGNVKQNVLSANGEDGLQLIASTDSVITANTADGNRNDGIELNSASTLNSIVNNTMQMNKEFDAADHGTGNTWTNNHCKTISGDAVCVH
jgi:parallel beta-helix repeat protein